MIIVRAPFRISLFGGGTDFEWYFKDKGTRILSFCIDKFCYVSIRRLLPYFGFKYRISWSLIEEAIELSDISHPSIKACISQSGVSDGLEIHTVGDLPARTGLGSSSSFTAAMIQALAGYKEITLNSSELITETIRMEQCILKENVGIQDQIAVCQGGFGLTRISQDSSYSTIFMTHNEPIVREIDEKLMLVYSGITRVSSDIQGVRLDRRNKALLGRLDRLRELSYSFSEALINGNADWNLFTILLREAWKEKRDLLTGHETSGLIEEIYNKALTSGAECGKLLGAGGGGFFAFFVPTEKQRQFTQLMSPYVAIKANIHYSGVERIL